ncbi:WD repeat-containing protein 6 [Elasticomyces elasticus]|nr:WD repeat-containing protein 6 [Elasticomyces elasticus]
MSLQSSLKIRLTTRVLPKLWVMHHEYGVGKNLWSVAVSTNAQITGGADGAVAILTMNNQLANRNVVAPMFSNGSMATPDCDSLDDNRDTDRDSNTAGTTRSESMPKTQRWTVGAVLRAADAGFKSSSDKLRAYVFVAWDTLLLATDTGQILLGSTATGPPSEWKHIAQKDQLRGYSVATALPQHGLAFFAGTAGTVYCYYGTVLSEFVQAKGKIAGLFASDVAEEKHALSRPRVSLLVAEIATAFADVYVFCPQPDGTLSSSTTWRLDLPASTTITSVCHVQTVEKQIVFLGIRSGTILTYNLTEAGAVLCYSMYQIHAQESVTALQWILAAGSNDRHASGYLFSVGRDGSCAVHRLAKSDPGRGATSLGSFANGDASNQPVHGSSPSRSLQVADEGSIAVLMQRVHQTSFVQSLEGLYVDDDTGHLMLYGFRSKHFSLYDAVSEREVMAIDCGGAHRNWAFHPYSSRSCCAGLSVAANPIQSTLSTDAPRNITKTAQAHGEGRVPPESCGHSSHPHQTCSFVWTKASELYVRTSQVQCHTETLIQSGSHGREIKAVTVSSAIDGRTLIATGAEDTDIKIFELEHGPVDEDRSYQASATPHNNHTNFRCIRTIRKHNTGIQHLQWSEDGRYLFSSGGFEEFFVWRVTIGVPILDVGVLCLATCPTDSDVPDLRVMHFTAVALTKSPDEAEDSFLISMIYSDSTIKVYRFTSTTRTDKQWNLLQSGTYLTKCLTASIYLFTDARPTLLTAATDGHLAFWSLESGSLSLPTTVAWHSRTHVHQNAIHCVEAQKLGDGAWLVITGGDDGALGLFVCRATDSIVSNLEVGRCFSFLTLSQAEQEIDM